MFYRQTRLNKYAQANMSQITQLGQKLNKNGKDDRKDCTTYIRGLQFYTYLKFKKFQSENDIYLQKRDKNFFPEKS
jgi:hypothetical protein